MFETQKEYYSIPNHYLSLNKDFIVYDFSGRLFHFGDRTSLILSVHIGIASVNTVSLPHTSLSLWYSRVLCAVLSLIPKQHEKEGSD